MNRWSLRVRVTVIGVVTLALMLSIGSWVTVRALASALRSDTAAQNDEVLDELASQIEQGVDPRILVLPVGADGTEFLILDDGDRLLNFSFSRPAPGPGPGSSVDPNLLVIESGPVRFGSEVEMLEFLYAMGEQNGLPALVTVVDGGIAANNDWFETRRTIEASDGSELTLVALSPFAVISRSIDRLALALAIIVPLIVAFGGVALWLAIGSALRPVRRVTDEAKRIAPSNSGDRLPVPDSADEIAELTVTLNGMLDRLDAGLIRQRQFVSDASHELRSPLTAVKGAAELVAANEDLPKDAGPSIQTLGRGVARLEAVLDDLTELADAGGNLARTEVDLADLIQAEVEAIGERDGIEINTSAVPPIVIQAHTVRLSRAVHNLLANAVRHADRKVTVAVSAAEGDKTKIVIDDDGRGIARSDRERVFERFVRLDDARTRASGGSGLGLALVASIAADHGGTVTCSKGELGGARFELVL